MGTARDRRGERLGKLFLATILAIASALCALDGAAAAARRAGDEDTGTASWYGKWHHGLPTASGETFDLNKLTAAHPTLPLGTRLRVTNRQNGRSVEVRVNDRGPRVPGRTLDLSRAAAAAIGAVKRGVIPVRLRVVGGPSRR